MVSYYAVFEPDRKTGGFVVEFPDFGYGATQGETLEVTDRGRAVGDRSPLRAGGGAV